MRRGTWSPPAQQGKRKTPAPSCWQRRRAAEKQVWSVNLASTLSSRKIVAHRRRATLRLKRNLKKPFSFLEALTPQKDVSTGKTMTEDTVVTLRYARGNFYVARVMILCSHLKEKMGECDNAPFQTDIPAISASKFFPEWSRKSEESGSSA